MVRVEMAESLPPVERHDEFAAHSVDAALAGARLNSSSFLDSSSAQPKPTTSRKRMASLELIESE